MAFIKDETELGTPITEPAPWGQDVAHFGTVSAPPVSEPQWQPRAPREEGGGGNIWNPAPTPTVNINFNPMPKQQPAPVMVTNPMNVPASSRIAGLYAWSQREQGFRGGKWAKAYSSAVNEGMDPEEAVRFANRVTVPPGEQPKTGGPAPSRGGGGYPGRGGGGYGGGTPTPPGSPPVAPPVIPRGEPTISPWLFADPRIVRLGDRDLADLPENARAEIERILRMLGWNPTGRWGAYGAVEWVNPGATANPFVNSDELGRIVMDANALPWVRYFFWRKGWTTNQPWPGTVSTPASQTVSRPGV